MYQEEGINVATAKQFRLVAKGLMSGSMVVGLILPMVTIRTSSIYEDFPEFVMARVFSAYFSIVDTSDVTVDPWNAGMVQVPGTWFAFLLVVGIFGFAYHRDKTDEYINRNVPAWHNILMVVGWIAGGWIALQVFVIKEYLPSLLYEEGIPSSIVITTTYGLPFYMLILGLVMTGVTPIFAQDSKIYDHDPSAPYQGQPQYQANFQTGYQQGYQTQPTQGSPESQVSPSKLGLKSSQSSRAVFCVTCGNKFGDDDDFCMNCGQARS